MSASTSITLPPVLDRLRRAWNAHDINTVTGCFHPGYKSIHPHHPERNTLGLTESVAVGRTSSTPSRTSRWMCAASP